MLLLGPQVRFILNEMKNICGEKNIPVEVIDMMNYGMCNGEAILEQAIKLIEKSSIQFCMYLFLYNAS